jgi:hypothetical protein
MSLDGYSGGSGDAQPPGVDPRVFRDFDDLETALLKEWVPIGEEAILYGATPGYPKVSTFKKILVDDVAVVALSSREIDLTVIDPSSPSYQPGIHLISQGGASPADFLEPPAPPGAYLDGTGQIVISPPGGFIDVYHSIVVCGQVRATAPTSDAYSVCGLTHTARTGSNGGGIGRAITGDWYRRRSVGDPASPLILVGGLLIQQKVTAPGSAWQPVVLHFSAQQADGGTPPNAAVSAGGSFGPEPTPIGTQQVVEAGVAIDWDQTDREIFVGVKGMEIIVQHIEVHGRGAL